MTGTARPDRIHDLVGIGIGPFNLGLACLAEPLDLDAVFLDGADDFRWHHGMLLEGSTIQVPFLADLVSMADPTSRFSFLNWLKQRGRLYPFYIRESFYPLRAEYDAYCRWASEQLASLRWGRRVVAVERDEADDCFVVRAVLGDGTEELVRGRHLVLGTGTAPTVPAALADVADRLVHSADYLHRRDELVASPSIAIIGSGQSAAEIYRDLLEEIDAHEYRLDWITRSPRFFPMEYTKLTLEMTSPEYTEHFHGLPQSMRDRLGREQRGLYKGISGDLVDDIYDTLYRKSAARPVPTTLLTDTELLSARPTGSGLSLRLRHGQLGAEYEREVASVVVATGYAPRVPEFLEPIDGLIDRDALGRFEVALDYTIDGGRGRIFVQNAEEHTHGLTAPDLGFGAWRNSNILAAILGSEPYPIERRIAFQEFGVPADADVPGRDRPRPTAHDFAREATR
ncbi:lysine N(6)-hydroxylase/L-ornithine N(5)-oxygenase family protein [Agromyces seonyuensis]|uniref:L-lysine N6-monooxygenase MbtG n=1 Tax=Agromyces seonyuensis TaxID=2662446 RepID=A0A6I4P5G2_9MICO|nr:SidA/IucD/PvdA family monooxygenase [Agromyces seonyuensis]MWB99669.1 SidA/IucD/PvdA family monooxygenase [Agromyces seonyuensis]